jgi:hypothetical protein
MNSRIIKITNHKRSPILVYLNNIQQGFEFNDKILVSGWTATNRGICCVTLVAKRLFGHTNCKRIETLESMDVSNVTNNTLVSWNWFDI